MLKPFYTLSVFTENNFTDDWKYPQNGVLYMVYSNVTCVYKAYSYTKQYVQQGVLANITVDTTSITPKISQEHRDIKLYVKTINNERKIYIDKTSNSINGIYKDDILLPKNAAFDIIDSKYILQQSKDTNAIQPIYTITPLDAPNNPLVINFKTKDLSDEIIHLLCYSQDKIIRLLKYNHVENMATTIENYETLGDLINTIGSPKKHI